MARRFSIVIVLRNGAQMLLKALAALHAACDPARDEIFVVDNGSDDGSADEVARAWPDVQLIRNCCNNGFARANNVALRQASGQYLLLINPDTVVQETTFHEMLQFLRSRPDVENHMVSSYLLIHPLQQKDTQSSKNIKPTDLKHHIGL